MRKIYLSISTFLFCHLLNAQIPTSGLVARYTFNNNTNDTTINGNDMGPVNGNGGLNYVTGINGAAVNFAQGGNCEILERTSMTGLTDGSFTVSAWVNMIDSVNTTPVNIAVGRNNISNFPTFSIENYNNGSTSSIDFYVYYDFTYTDYQVIYLPVPTDSWHHVSFVYNAGDSIYTYMDGVRLPVFTLPTNSDTLNDVTSKLNMGANTPYCNVLGSTDEFLIYNRALNDVEIAQIYAAQNLTMGIELNNTNIIKVFPNPTADVVNIQTKDNSPIELISLMNMDGKVIKQFNTGQNTLSLIDVKPGTYLLSVMVNGQRSVSRIIKN